MLARWYTWADSEDCHLKDGDIVLVCRGHEAFPIYEVGKVKYDSNLFLNLLDANDNKIENGAISIQKWLKLPGF
jgi:hypothetical protein